MVSPDEGEAENPRLILRKTLLYGKTGFAQGRFYNASGMLPVAPGRFCILSETYNLYLYKNIVINNNQFAIF
jgi:hypothetical protein